jgi:hypothetical protein
MDFRRVRKLAAVDGGCTSRNRSFGFSQSVLIIAAVLLLTVLGACELFVEDSPEYPQITEVSAGADTVTVTFSQPFTQVSMPNSLVFAAGTCSFDVLIDPDSAGMQRIGHYGLLSADTDSLTLAMLTEGGPSTAEHAFALYTGEFLNSPVMLSESEGFTFGQAGTLTTVTVIIQDPQEIYASFQEGGNLLTDVTASETALFDASGAAVAYSFAKGSDVDPLLPDHEFQLTPSAGSSFSGSYTLRFARSGLSPSFLTFTIDE